MIRQAYNSWNFYWRMDQKKNNSPYDDQAWAEYLESLSMIEILENLAFYEDENE